MIAISMALLLLAPGAEPNWVVAARGAEGVVMYIDLNSIVRRGSLVEVDFLNDSSQQDGAAYVRQTGRERFDCAARSMRTLRLVSYYADGRQDDPLGAETRDQLVNTGTTSESVMNRVCRR